MSEAFIKDDYFKIDPEPHLIGNMEPVNHFPGVQMWWRAIANIGRPLSMSTPPEYYEGMDPHEIEKDSNPNNLLEAPMTCRAKTLNFILSPRYTIAK